MKKRILSAVLVLVMLTSMIIPTTTAAVEPTHPFTDIGKHASWATSYLNDVYERGIMNGVTATEFGPDEIFTREQLVTTLFRMSGDYLIATTTEDLAKLFPDADLIGNFAKNAVMWAYKNGITKGVTSSDGTIRFNPKTPVTKQETATFIVRFADFVGITLPSDKTVTIHDIDLVSAFAEESVKRCIAAGIINGDNGYFHPTDATKRIYAAKMLACIPEKPPVVSLDARDPDPTNIGELNYGDLILSDGLKISQVTTVTDGKNNNQFTATALGTHGWHETRMVRNEYGTFIVFAQDEQISSTGTYLGQYTYAVVTTKFMLVRVTANGFEKLLEGTYPSSHSGSAQVNVLAGNDGMIYVTAFGIDPESYLKSDLNDYYAYLNVYEYDTKNNKTGVATEDMIKMVYDPAHFLNAPAMNAGYYQPMLDNANNKLYCIFAAGGKAGDGYLSWFNYDLETHKWDDKNYLAKTPDKTVSGKAVNPMRIEYFNLYSDNNGGLFGVAQRTTSTQEMQDYYRIYKGIDIPFNTHYGFTWDALYLFTIPDMTKEEVLINDVLFEPDYTDRDEFPINSVGFVTTRPTSHYEGGTTFLASNGYLYVVYSELSEKCKLVVYDTKNDFKRVSPTKALKFKNNVLNSRYQIALSENIKGEMFLVAVNTLQESELEAYSLDVSKSNPISSLIKDSAGKTASVKLTQKGSTTGINQYRLTSTTTRAYSIQDNVLGLLTCEGSPAVNRYTSMDGVSVDYDCIDWSGGTGTSKLYYISVEFPG